MFEYERKQAPHERLIIKSCLAHGKPYPKKIADAPQLEPENEFFYNAFSFLGTCRYYELGPIPYSVVKSYGEQYELEYEQMERFIQVINSVDLWLRGEIATEIRNSNSG